ncbi:MAG: 16S rRNA (guanine(966)-N(2))-methyltransferase RsmD [Pseudomonadota bacterium]
MRIIAGRNKGTRLTSPKSRSVRPTSDRVRETIFNILEHGLGVDLKNARVLDLFAGTGALGLEALSRGASLAVFVDSGVEARGLIRQNVERTAATGQTRVFRRDAARLGPAGGEAPFDLCFADPPYGQALGIAALLSARSGGWLAPGAMCVLEESATEDLNLPAGFTEADRRVVGETVLVFVTADGISSDREAVSRRDDLPAKAVSAD